MELTLTNKESIIFTMKTLTKHAGGRPSKFNKELTALQVDEYLETCGRNQTKLPTIEGLALFLKVSRDTLYEWKKLDKEFSYTIDRLQMLQKDQLINDGIYGGREVNSQIVKLLLQANHGLKENEPSTMIQVNIRPILGELKAE